MKILLLTLKKEPFEVMITGEKNYEIREFTPWILTRLYERNGSRKNYDVVRFSNGYRKDSPYFIAEFKGFETIFSMQDTFSNGFHLEFHDERIKINLGVIIEMGNLKEC